MKFHKWYIELKDGRQFCFYTTRDKEKNPLLEIEEFDQGENWSLDLLSDLEDEYPLDPEDDSFVLIPKNHVVRVFCV